MENKELLLVPEMVEPHFTMLEVLANRYGFNLKILHNRVEEVLKTGLKYVHNDMCYPAILVIGQMISALESGEYDLNNTSLVITQTGGGCRASNYIYLLRKALERAGLNIKVYSLNAKKIDDNTIKLPFNMILEAIYGLLYADLIKSLYNETRSYEVVKGSSLEALKRASDYVLEDKLNYHFKEKIEKIIAIFKEVELKRVPKVRVGIVGEIYLKFAPLGNNDLEDYLVSLDCEPVVSGLMDFGLYCLQNNLIDDKLYERDIRFTYFIQKGIDFVVKKQKFINEELKKNGFHPGHSFDELVNLASEVIGVGTKMGEGWLLSSEISAYLKHGVNAVISCQPFGCLPNHIVAKGVTANIRKIYPEANLLALDYDPSISKANQENRINLMVMNAKKRLR